MATEIYLQYYVVFGMGDGSDNYDYAMTIEGEEEQAYLKAMKYRLPFENFPELGNVLDRTENEIYKLEEENSEDLGFEDEDFSSYSITVEFSDNPEEDDLSEEEARATLTEMFNEANGNYDEIYSYIERCEFLCEENLSDIAAEVANSMGIEDFETDTDDNENI